jgi:hypothetical protein
MQYSLYQSLGPFVNAVHGAGDNSLATESRTSRVYDVPRPALQARDSPRTKPTIGSYREAIGEVRGTLYKVGSDLLKALRNSPFFHMTH